MSRLRVGIVGAGEAAARLHLPGYVASPDAEVVAIASRRRAPAEALAARFAIPRVCGSPAELLAQTDVDAVSICTPPSTHADLLEMACAAGKHVLLEKPIATSLGSLDLMRRLAQESRSTIEVVHNERFMDFNLGARRIVRSRRLGEVQAIVQFVGTTGPESWTEGGGWYRSPDVAGGGALIDLAVHKIDVAGWLVDEDVVSADSAQLSGGVEDLGAFHGATAGGVLVSVCASWRGPADESTLLVVGTEATLEGCASLGTLSLRSQAAAAESWQTVPPWGEDDDSAVMMIWDFVRACREGRRPVASDPLWDSATRRVLETYAKVRGGPAGRIG
jgi:UDP-N-acetylglucosamine 3-dehydrogenase